MFVNSTRLFGVADPNPQDRVRSLVLRAYAESEATAAQVVA
jgi:hypothetical protein